jgi:hypothetical protein
VQLHTKNDLQAAAIKIGSSLQDLLLQQITYLAGVRLELQSVAPAQQQQHGGRNNRSTALQGLRLLNSQCQLVPSGDLYLPPRDTAALELLQDLQEAGSGLRLLHSCFEPCWRSTSSEQYLLLTTTLGVRQADTAAVVEAVVQLHRQGSARLAEKQRIKHLAYLAQYIAFLQQHPPMLQQVQDAVLLLDARGQHSRPKQLHLPLGANFVDLESDMCAAGMLFLHSSYTAAATATEGAGVSTSSSIQRKMAGKQLQELLILLGVQESNVNSIMQHALKLYSSSRTPRPTAQQHMSHLTFIADRWGDAQERVQQQVVASLPLVAADAAMVLARSTGSATSSSAASSISNIAYLHETDNLYILPAATSQLTPLLHALGLGGAHFLHPMYAEGRDDGLVLWLLQKPRCRC